MALTRKQKLWALKKAISITKKFAGSEESKPDDVVKCLDEIYKKLLELTEDVDNLEEVKENEEVKKDEDDDDDDEKEDDDDDDDDEKDDDKDLEDEKYKDDT